MRIGTTTIQIAGTIIVAIAMQSPVFGGCPNTQLISRSCTPDWIVYRSKYPFGNRVEQSTTVRFETNVGDFDVTLYDDLAPNTVSNFLNYVTDGDYNDSLIHRSVAGFVVQGGRSHTDFSNLPADPPVIGEVGLSNVRGTIAMAHSGNDPDSATSEWFINLVDNDFLDTDGGGFTVFGEVTPIGMETVDSIAALPTISETFPNLPVLDKFGGASPSNLVKIHRISVVPEPSAALVMFSCLVLCLPVIRNMRTRTNR